MRCDGAALAHPDYSWRTQCRAPFSAVAAARSAAIVAVAVAAELPIARPGLVHFDVAVLDFAVTRLIDSLADFLGAANLDEAGAPCLSGEPSLDHRCAPHLIDLRVQVVESIVGNPLEEVADIQSARHQKGCVEAAPNQYVRDSPQLKQSGTTGSAYMLCFRARKRHHLFPPAINDNHSRRWLSGRLTYMRESEAPVSWPR